MDPKTMRRQALAQAIEITKACGQGQHGAPAQVLKSVYEVLVELHADAEMEPSLARPAGSPGRPA